MSERIRESGARILNTRTIDMPEMEDVLALYRELFKVTMKDAVPVEGERELSGEEQTMRLSEGFTLVDPGDIVPLAEPLASRAREIYGVLCRHSESAEHGEGDIVDDPAKMAALAAHYLAEGEDALRREVAGLEAVNPERIMFVVFNALKGAFTAAAHRFADVDTQAWEKGTCPVCGGLPAVAYLEGEGGQRHLVCHRCETAWRFMRICCPFCGNRNHEELGFFTVEGRDDLVRVDFCRRCHGYIKTWDIREREGSLPEVDDLLTPGLDLAAEKEGFSRGAPNIFGIWIGFEGND